MVLFIFLVPQVLFNNLWGKICVYWNTNSLSVQFKEFDINTWQPPANPDIICITPQNSLMTLCSQFPTLQFWSASVTIAQVFFFKNVIHIEQQEWTPVRPASFAWHNVSESHPCLACGGATAFTEERYPMVGVLQFAHPFTSSRASGLFPVFGYAHLCTAFMRIYVLSFPG